jgi:nucleoside transporter
MNQSSALTSSMPTPVKGVMLSVMMFMQYAVWGVWLPYLSSYLQAPTDTGGLGFTGAQIGWILGLAGSIGAIAAPFLAGQIADRFINAEIYLGILLIIGGVIKFATFYVSEYETFLVMSIAYSIVYMPTLALTNSIAFAHLKRPESSFPLVRVWGTIGWIVASNLFPLLWLQYNLELTALPPFLAGTEKDNASALIGNCLRVSGVMAVGYGLWAMLMLPRTPPARKAENPFAFAKAFVLLAKPSVAVLVIAALFISMIHQVYFIRTSPFLEAIGFKSAHTGPVMSIGQFAEILVLGLLGVILATLGYRWTLVLGALAFAVRFAIFAVAAEETKSIVLVAMTLHGFCYACFFAASFIYVERIASADIRHSAQTVYGIVILGAGPILAGFYNEWLDVIGTVEVTDAETGIVTTSFDYEPLWWVQATIGLAVAFFLAFAFRSQIRKADPVIAGTELEGLEKVGE